MSGNDAAIAMSLSREEDPDADIADVQAVDFSIADLRALIFRNGDSVDDAADAEFYKAPFTAAARTGLNASYGGN